MKLNSNILIKFVYVLISVTIIVLYASPGYGGDLVNEHKLIPKGYSSVDYASPGPGKSENPITVYSESSEFLLGTLKAVINNRQSMNKLSQIKEVNLTNRQLSIEMMTTHRFDRHGPRGEKSIKFSKSLVASEIESRMINSLPFINKIQQGFNFTLDFDSQKTLDDVQRRKRDRYTYGLEVKSIKTVVNDRSLVAALGYEEQNAWNYAPSADVDWGLALRDAEANKTDKSAFNSKVRFEEEQEGLDSSESEEDEKNESNTLKNDNKAFQSLQNSDKTGLVWIKGLERKAEMKLSPHKSGAAKKALKSMKMPVMQFEINQTQDVMKFRFVSEGESFQKWNGEYTFNIPVRNKMSIGRVYNHEYEVLRSSLEGIPVLKNVDLNVHYLDPYEQVRYELLAKVAGTQISLKFREDAKKDPGKLKDKAEALWSLGVRRSF